MVYEVNFDEISSFLSTQPANTVDTPLKLKIVNFPSDFFSETTDTRLSDSIKTRSDVFLDLSETIMPVFESAYYCFNKCFNLVFPPVLQEGTTNLSNFFYDCSSLKVAPKIPTTCTYLDFCFEGCSALTSVPEIPASVISMRYAFRRSGIKEVKGIFTTKAMDFCFEQCESLEKADIEITTNSVAYLFNGCSSLVYLDLTANGLTSAFNPIGNLGRGYVPDSNWNKGFLYFSFKANNATDLYFSLKNVPLSSIYIEVSKAKTVTLDWLSAAEVYVNAPSAENTEITNLYGSIAEFVIKKGSGDKFTYPVFENKSTGPYDLRIKAEEFDGIDTLFKSECPLRLFRTRLDFKMPTNLDECFSGCKNLYSVSADLSGVESMVSCFDGCSNLYEIPVIPETVTNIDRCFSDCTRLKEVYIKANDNISITDAFSGSSVETIYTTNKPLIESLLGEEASNFTVVFFTPYSELQSWMEKQTANDISSSYELKVTEIPMSFVSDLSTKLKTRNDVYVNLTKTELPSVESLDSCFDDCVCLTKAPKIPEVVKSMNRCFRNCSNLKESPAIPNQVEDLSFCFENCSCIEVAPVLPKNLVNIKGCFSDCIALKEGPEIPATVKDLTKCFAGTSILVSPKIPNETESMEGCFTSCEQLVEAPIIPSSVLNLNSCFENCLKLETVPVVPSFVRKMNNAFLGCTSLRTIQDWQIKDLSTVELNGVFEGCNNLENIFVYVESSTDKYSLVHLSSDGSMLDYSFVNAKEENFGTVETSEEEDIVVNGLIDEVAYGYKGFVPKEKAFDVLEKKVPFSNKYKDFSPDDPHMVLWAKDPNKVKTNIFTGEGESGGMPCGTIVPYYSASIPDGWLLCDGKEFDSRQYPALYMLLNDNHTPNLVGKYLQGNTSAGTEIDAGLPNIKGSLDMRGMEGGEATVLGTYSGALYRNNYSGSSHTQVKDGGTGYYRSRFGFDASRSNSIYGKSSTVTPPSVTVLYIIKATTGITTNLESVTVQNIKDYIDEKAEIKITSLWSGRSSTSAQTITLSDSINNYKFVLVAGCMYTSSDEQKSSVLIPVSEAMYSTTNAAWLLCGSISGTDRRIRFGFANENTLKKYESVGTDSHIPIITNVWGVK